ncbi:transporter (NhaC family) [Desulfitobacterium sp. LBE]|uniref:Malate-2H(+)/Na(+)-lactate antiporter n=3 Tax=root TaxID=1 RepID=A0A098B4M5_DESHA|nr:MULTISPECIES: Na+/H+ antiporter NhaC [Desulfitobacterium]ACL19771.1 Na+/H+ antiporter NhaC [Desulfitobacterium hafniense DCB-2]MEA5025233.1 Na+/H+ antiporter NhaC [Desulfitobacterium hafniense]TWH57385.1 transporter (NhaC family) [Desulfitobacterium sp. LBE]CDX03814.1 Malate-2H(+)/Na(+)-lactate antiporter [Desulfitobacterium hafniense]
MDNDGSRKKPGLMLAVVAFIIPVLVILWGVVFAKLPALLPIIIATTIACLIGKLWGYSWDEMQKGMFDSIYRVHIAILILIAVGMLIGVWILAGTIPTIIYWGLKLISPSGYLVTAFLLCIVASTATGSSFGTMGTVGIALLGVGQALGYPLPLVVGAIVSGAYFGDKMSPVSDSTNIASSVCEVNLFSHIGSMMWTTIPAAVVTAVIYIIMGINHSGGSDLGADVTILLQSLETTFNLSLWTLVPPVLLILLAYRRVPAVPLLMVSVVLGAIVAALFQGQSMIAIINSTIKGYVGSSGVAQLDSLLTRGGINSITGTVMLLISAVSFGGVLEKIGVLGVIVDASLKWATTTGRLIVSVIFASYIMLIGTGSQAIAMIIPARAYAPVFKERGLHLRVLSRTVEDSGCIASPLLPWSVHAFYILGVLGVSAYEYAPYAFMCWIVPIFSIIYGYTGFAIWRADNSPIRKPAPEVKDSGNDSFLN